jgi:hypothetical protein
MKKEKVVFDFLKVSVTEKVEYAQNVMAKMKDNPSFPTPDVSLADLKAKTDLVQSRSVASLSGGKEATALLHQAVEDWEDIMRKMAKYADRIADGDGAIILSAGFSLAKTPAPRTHVEFSVELGDKPGTVILRHQAVEGAKSYIWQYFAGEIPTSENNWMLGQVTSKATVEISGLTPLTKYWFRVAAVTSDGTSPYCPAVMQVVI